MIPSHYQARFNPQFTVPHSRVKSLLITIKQFGGSEKTEVSRDTSTIDPAMMEMGRTIMRELEEAKDALITELVTLAFNLSNEERDSLDFQVREEMYEMIADARPELIRFLSLSSPRESVKTESQNPHTELSAGTYSMS